MPMEAVPWTQKCSMDREMFHTMLIKLRVSYLYLSRKSPTKILLVKGSSHGNNKMFSTNFL